MPTVGIRELKQNTSEILRRVREDFEPAEVTYRGEVIARIVPVLRRSRPNRARSRAVWDEIDRIAEQISARMPKRVSAVRAVREQRRG
jgi:prevent-host-death family protein